MKITLNEVKTMQEGLDAILAEKIPCKPGYWFKRFLNKVSSELKAMEETRIKTVEAYAKKDKDGKPLFKKDKDGKQLEPPQYDLSKENLEKLQKELFELGNIEFEVDQEPIKLSDIDSEVCEVCGQKKLVIKPLVWIQLGKLVEE